MRAGRLAMLLGVAALAVASTGCFTSWVVVQGMGAQRSLEEGAREEVVPLPGITERLTVALPLARASAATTGAGAATGAATPAPSAAPAPFALRCTTQQLGRDRRHRAAYRYGQGWKRATAVLFFVEAATAALFLLASDDERTEPADRGPYRLAAGYFALDAIGTGALFFAPRKEIVRAEELAVTTEIRADCPDGLALLVGADAYPIDAAGRIGELGEAALDAWMRQPQGSLAIALEGRATDLRVGQREQCAWLTTRGAGAEVGCPPATVGYGATTAAAPVAPIVAAVIDVPVGSLSSLPAAP